MEEISDKKARSCLKWMLKASAVLVLLLAAFILSIPFLIAHISLPEFEFDVSPYLEENAAVLVSHRKITARIIVRRGETDGFRISATGRILDWPYHAMANVRFSFVHAKGDFTLSLDGTDWRLDAEFDASGSKDWRFHASMPETPFSHADPVIAPILERLELSSVSNIAFNGTFALEADGSTTPERPVPVWDMRCSAKEVDASLETGGIDVRIDGLRLRFGARGIADHCDIAPLYPRANAISLSGLTLSNVFANVRATERAYLVTEAGASCGDGELRLYSLFLDPERLNAGATVFMDGVNANEVLARVSGFRGEASGRLHGKLPFFLKDGRSLRIKNAYLFSTPGEVGKVHITDARPILDSLAQSGVDKATRDNLEKALANLDYNVLKIELKRGKDGEDLSLGLKIEGSATHGNTTVPVRLDVTFHGDIDQLVNTGMKLSTGRKHR